MKDRQISRKEAFHFPLQIYTVTTLLHTHTCTNELHIHTNGKMDKRNKQKKLYYCNIYFYIYIFYQDNLISGSGRMKKKYDPNKIRNKTKKNKIV